MMKNVIGKEVRFFKVTVGLFLLLFSNCSVQNCLSPARNRGRSPPWPVWWAPWCKSSLLWRKECSQMIGDVVSGLVFPLGDGHFGWTVCLSWGVWEVGQVPALNYEGPHKTEILKGKGEIILVVCLVDGDTSLEEKALVWNCGVDGGAHQWLQWEVNLEGAALQTHTGSTP